MKMCSCLKNWLVPPPSLGLLLQDAPLSDCTDTIDGLDVSEGSYSPARSIRKVLTASVTDITHILLTSSSCHFPELAKRPALKRMKSIAEKKVDNLFLPDRICEVKDDAATPTSFFYYTLLKLMWAVKKKLNQIQ